MKEIIKDYVEKLRFTLALKQISVVPYLLIVFALMLSGCTGNDESEVNSDNNDTVDSIGLPTSTTVGLPSLPTQDPAKIDISVAIVNGEQISLQDFEYMRDAQLLMLDNPPEDSESFDLEILNEMIDMLLIRQYARENQISISRSQINQEIANLNELAEENDLPLSDLLGYPNELIDIEVNNILLIQAVSETLAQPNEAAIQANRVQARHIVVESEDDARQILDDLNSGADFSELAERFSIDVATARLGGNLGWIMLGDILQPELEAVIFDMSANSRWPDPIQTNLGFHIVEKLDVETINASNEARLAESNRRDFEQWLRDLRQTAEIEILLGTDANQENP